jgi:hypothetical protein
MKLITKAIEEEFEKYPYGSQEKTPLMEQKVLVKFFNPCGVGTWIITECVEKTEDGDFILWGLGELGYGYELGTVSLKELESLKLPFGLKIERDMYLKKNCKVKDLISEKDLM